MGLGPPRGHLEYWRRWSVPQPGRSARGSSPEFSPHSGAAGQPGCWGSGLQLTQCCQNSPGVERRELKNKNAQDKKRIEQQVE